MIFAASGCSSTPQRASTASQAPASEAILALVEGVPIRAVDLHAGVMEYAGAAALRDAVLDRLLDKEFVRLGISLTTQDIWRERELFLDGIADTAEAEGGQVALLVDSLRRARGLGPVNYDATLRRSAMLRKIVSGSAVVRVEDLDAAARVEFGPRIRARVLVVVDRDLAGSLRAALAGVSREELSMAFAGAAVEHSVDGTAGAGGLLARASSHDPGLASPIREALRTQREGEVGPVLSLERAYALVLVEARTPGREPTADERATLRERVRGRLERVAMESLAERLLTDAKVTVLDRSLRWSWDGESR